MSQATLEADSDGIDTETDEKLTRPLTATEWVEILTRTDFILRISDGTAEGSWYFWAETHDDHQHLYARRFDWEEPDAVSVEDLQEALVPAHEGEALTQASAWRKESVATGGNK